MECFMRMCILTGPIVELQIALLYQFLLFHITGFLKEWKNHQKTTHELKAKVPSNVNGRDEADYG